MHTLLCIPWSGASASVYRKWRGLLEDQVRLVPIELAGHGTRMRETCYPDWDTAMADLISQVRTHKGNGPWSLFGHSLGGLLSFELAHRLREEGLGAPARLFVSGANPPTWRPSGSPLHLIEDDRVFLERIFSLGGIPITLLQDPMLRAIFTPIIRSDYHLFETYEWRPRPAPLACPITAIAAARDPLAPPELVTGWHEFTTGPCDVEVFPEGNHFFIEQKTREVVSRVQRDLSAEGA